MKIDSVAVLRKKIAALEARLIDLRNLATATTKILDGMPHAKSRASPVERITVAIIETENELSAARSELQNLQPSLATAIIERVKAPALATVLILRDVQCLSFRETARRMNYCLRNVFNLHASAVAEFEKGECDDEQATAIC